MVIKENEKSVNQIKRLPLYLDEEIKIQIKEKATSLGLTSNAYIKMLILKDLGK